MFRLDSDRVKRHFSAGARDVTPVSARRAAHVLYAAVSVDPEISRHCTSLLSDSEVRRADRFAAEDDRIRFKQRRAFRRFCGAAALRSSKPLAQIEFEESENGRPYLAESPDIWFSFSSCRYGLLGAWSSTHAVGVDLEDQMRDLEAVALARRFFSQVEAMDVEKAGARVQTDTFVRFWCLKEAALKSIGEGLPFGLDTFSFELAPSLRVVAAPAEWGGPARFDACAIGGTECGAALVTRRLI